MKEDDFIFAGDISGRSLDELQRVRKLGLVLVIWVEIIRGANAKREVWETNLRRIDIAETFDCF